MNWHDGLAFAWLWVQVLKNLIKLYFCHFWVFGLNLKG